MAAVIFSGDVVRSLKDGLKLGNKATILSGTLDPTVTAVSASIGDVYISTTTGKIYSKTDSGLTTNWDQSLTVADLSYSQTFDSTTDWGAASGGFYTITVLQSTHQKGIDPSIQVFETNGSSVEMITTDLISINASGDVSFRVGDTPDLRFDGRVIIK